jgi:hypothetical protein
VSGAMRVGEWDWAIAQLEAALPEETDAMARGTALAGLLQFRALRGEDTSGLLAEMAPLAASLDAETGVRFLDMAHAHVEFASGDLAVARTRAAGFARTWQQGQTDGWRLATRAAIWTRDVDAARLEVAEFERTVGRGRAARVSRVTFQAGIAALEGRTSEAVAMYRDAIRGWQELGLPWDEALAGIDMAFTLGPGEPAVKAAATTTRTILEGLGAQAMLARLDGALSERRARREPAARASETREGASA